MNPDLVHATCDGRAFHQGVVPECFEGVKSSLCFFSFARNAGGTVILLKDGRIDEFIFKVMNAIRYSVVDFFYLPVLKLHAQVTISLRITCNGQNSGCIFIQAVAYLRIGLYFPYQLQNIGAFVSVFQRGDEWRFIDQQVILIFINNSFFEVEPRVFQFLIMEMRCKIDLKKRNGQVMTKYHSLQAAN